MLNINYFILSVVTFMQFNLQFGLTEACYIYWEKLINIPRAFDSDSI